MKKLSLLFALALSMLLTVTDLKAQIRMPGSRVAGTPATSSILNASDISYLGAIRGPAAFDTSGVYGGIGGRKVAGHVHLFFWGHAPGTGVPSLAEGDINGLTPNTDYTMAPRITSYVNCGDVMHGLRESWLSGSPQNLDGLSGLQQSLYWNDATSMLYWTYVVGYTDPNYWTMGGTTFGSDCSTSTAYGPWEIDATDKESNVWKGWRSHMMATHPTTGKMLLGGTAKGGEASLSYGPSMFGDADWPTTSTTGGQFMTPISQPNEYLNYYFPSGTYNGVTGAPQSTIKQMSWNLSSMGLFYNFELSPFSTPEQVNPSQNSGNGTWGDTQYNVNTMYWFEGTYKRGVIYLGVMPVSQVNSADCTTAAHEWYANVGNGHFTMSSVTGFINGEQVKGLTSNMTATLQSVTPSPYLGWQQGSSDCGGGICSNAYNFTIGETVQGQTSHATATILTQRRYDVCNHGCSPVNVATGPSSTVTKPIMFIYDPDKLNNVKNNSVTDYLQTPDSIIDLLDTYSIRVAPEGTNGAARDVSGMFFDTATNNFYIGARSADDTSPYASNFLGQLFQVFHINDAPIPEPAPVETKPWSTPLGIVEMMLAAGLIGTKIREKLDHTNV